MSHPFHSIRSCLKEKVLMKSYVFFRTGGRADYLFEPDSADLLKEGLTLFKQAALPVFMLGAGAKVLVHDDGFRGVVIRLRKGAFAHMDKRNDLVYECGSGVMGADLAQLACREGVQGFEFLCGFPSSLGGAIHGNSGTKDGTIGPLLENMMTISPATGEEKRWDKKEMDWKYRSFPALKDSIILSAVLRGMKGDTKTIADKMESIRLERGKNEPKGFSCGSIFKNAATIKAWEVIDQLGYRGYGIGGAQVSFEHPNWIVNKGRATSKNIWDLICLIRTKAKEKFDVTLELELNLLGDFMKNSTGLDT
ncbi:MAG: UDP-N-acetylmuramate dehydrogenase [Candidatus Aureabacteria bacterium]|nr:UDP-N-acetylmuramate dehydrogenase [Candidatus Auribacterota bacterium]